VPDLFQRLKTALADRYAIEEELVGRHGDRFDDSSLSD